MDNLRKRKRNDITADIEPDDLQHSADPHSEIVWKEFQNNIHKAVELLSLKQKEVFLLRVNGEMSFREIADTTKEPLNTVLSHMHYSVKKIKSFLGNKNEQ
jgi:RNA polymerase sigma factor (sigma-70 family)